ncbi:MAG: Hsp20/alpha crystallin family protein [Algoriphagus sp.]|uniref:Hsp20/alpha crystallin family protein n=1 Tax=Algoriphagus sp. TaxID=1872435 RepID=UPI0017B99C19|nr:Hsp20/alpha crystallin family protein [Algoriphagus sp.]NVJ86347.1 Hsp20/alpha crystallin family protein [Algoriphagus sp.]
MGTITKRSRGFWPKMAQDFFGAENPFEWDNKFWMTDKSVEVPSANVIENDKEFKIELSAPGFDKKDFKVEVEDGVLNIFAEKEHRDEEEKENYRKKEFSYTSIRRSFVLPENVAEETIDAKYENGLLRLVLPKSKMAQKDHKKAIEVG